MATPREPLLPSEPTPLLPAAVAVDSPQVLPTVSLVTVALSPTAAAPAGTNLAVPGYEVLRELGRGGVGVVYQARHRKLNRLVALKMLLAGSHAGPADLGRFQTEAEAIARLQHPNIVQVHEVGEHEGRPFFSLEFCGGGSLERKLNRTPLPPTEAAALVEVLARAMQAAHEKGVIHRDLKPANVLLTEDGTPKITDFGLARKLDEAGQTASGAVMGTPSYMAPEQAGGQAVGPLADVYALGAILYECLTGRPPFRAATLLDTLEQVRTQEPVPPTRLQPRTPRDLETICLKCLRKDPAGRYATAGDLAADLGRHRAGEPITARPAGRLERLVRWCRRRPAVAALLALLAVVGTAGTGLVTWKWREASALAVAEGRQRQEAEESERLALRNLYEARLASITQAWAERDFARLGLLVDEAAPSPGKPDFRGWEWYFFLAQARTSRTALAGSGPYAGRLAWCEERKLLAAATAEGAIDVWDRQEQRLLRTLPAQGGKVLRLAWRPDGRQLASAGEDTRLRIWDVDSAQVLRALPGRALATEPPALAWSPDGRLLACAGEGPTVQLWDTERWEPARPLEINQPTAIMLDLAWHPDSTRLAGALRYGTLALWDVRQGRLLAARNVGTGGYAFSVAWNPDGSKLAVGAFADMFPRPAVSLWDGSARFLGHLMPGMEQVACVRWSPDGRTLAASGSDNTVTFLDTQVMAPVLKARFAAFGGPVEFAWDSGADRLLIGADHLYVVDPQSLRARGVVLGSPRARLITSVRHSPDGRWLAASICGDNRGSPDVPDPVAVWDARTGKIARRLSHPPGHFYAVRWSPDSRRLVGVDYRGNFPVWDAATGQMVWKGAAGEDFSADRLAWSPDGRWLACLGQRRVVFWDAARGEKTRELAWAAPRIGRYLGWSPDGRLFSAAGLVWETDGWEQQEPLSGPDDPPYSLCWSPDGRAIAATNEQGWIQFMEMASRREAGAQPAHNGRAVVAWSPDGRRVASGGPEGTVRIWDPATHKSLVTLSLDKIPVTALDWSPDGRSLVCGCGEGNVRVLRADDSMPAAPPF